MLPPILAVPSASVVVNEVTAYAFYLIPTSFLF